MSLEQGSGAPSFCWHCNRQLRRAPGRGLGLFHFALVQDKGGAIHRVHGDCAQLMDEVTPVKQPAEVQR